MGLCSCVFMGVFYVFHLRPAFTFVFPFYPKNCFGVDPQEKAKEVKAVSELKDLFQIADVDSGVMISSCDYRTNP